MSCSRADIVLLSTADWDNPFWTNKQHVAECLANLGHRVLYIDSVGLRRPSANGGDLRRVGRRLRKISARPRRVATNLWVWSPTVIPLHEHALVRRANKAVLSTFQNRISRLLGFSNPWLWTYNPLTIELLSLDGFEKIIYHCVDDISVQPGMPKELIQKSEKTLLYRSDIVFTTSLALQEKCLQFNHESHYFSNVADFNHFRRANEEDIKIPSDLSALPRPRLGFIGAISAYKLDFDLLRAVADAKPSWSIVLIGLIGEGDPDTDISALRACPNIHFLGARDYKILPNYLKGIDVALLPNRLNDYTRSMFPMKFFEYLAAGKPVISTNLLALQEYSDFTSIVGSTGEFISAVERLVADDGPQAVASRQAVAQNHTYATRTAKMCSLIERNK